MVHSDTYQIIPLRGENDDIKYSHTYSITISISYTNRVPNLNMYPNRVTN